MSRPGLTRRRLLVGGAAAAGALAVGGGARAEPGAGDPAAATVPCWGSHQAGIDTPPPAFASFTALRLNPGTGPADVARLMRVWSDDISRLTQGRPALADLAPELAAVPARLTVTIGFGPGLFRLPGLRRHRPAWLEPLPAFRVDRLEDRWSGGDLLVQVRADDPVTISHAQRVLAGDAAGFAQVAWVQPGFQRASGMAPEGATGRNLMGYVDGTVNPVVGTADFDAVVWAAGTPAWLSGGTGVVIRRIRMDLAAWPGVDRHSREQVMGRRLDTGAPLTGSAEADVPDLAARDDRGLLTIPEFAHVRLAHSRTHRFLRRPYNYDDGAVGGRPDAGQLFVAYAADLAAQFVPVQRRLATVDALNTWTTPVGSAVFAIPPGFAEGGYVGETLLG